MVKCPQKQTFSFKRLEIIGFYDLMSAKSVKKLSITLYLHNHERALKFSTLLLWVGKIHFYGIYGSLLEQINKHFYYILILQTETQGRGSCLVRGTP